MNVYFLAALALMTVCAVAVLLYPSLRRRDPAVAASALPYLAAALLVPVLAIGLYAVLGSPPGASAGSASTAPSGRPSAPSRQDGVASVASLVEGLAERLAREPDDAGGWLLLAKSYRHLDRREDTRAAYERAAALGRNDPDIEGYLSGSGDGVAAVAVSGRVSIADDRLSELVGSESVFVVARAVAGSPAPLAVVRTTVSALPFEFRMTDADAMIAGNDLSSADAVVVTAKVSADGDALNTLPGFDAVSEPFSPTGSPYLVMVLGGGQPMPQPGDNEDGS